jgi:hypothetical protein
MAGILTEISVAAGLESYGAVEGFAPATQKKNCWEFKKCGREPGGSKVAELGVCPAAQEAMFDGVFGGTNSGRACWVVAGTFCKGEVQGTFAQKFKNCARCEFFRRVQEEEGENFRPVNILLSYIDRTHEQRVDERTHELREAKEAVEAANAKLEETNRKLERVNHIASLDMSMASRLQASFFPKTPPKSGAWDSAFVFKPLSGVSGDFYDFYVKNRELRGASLFDVSGHGIAPGLLTLLARSIVHQQFHAGEKRKLGGIVEIANRALVKELDAIENYVTGIVLRFTGDRVEYVNAGHTDLLLRRSASGKVIKVEPPGGIFADIFSGRPGLKTRSRPFFSGCKKTIPCFFSAIVWKNPGMPTERNTVSRESRRACR